MTMASGLYGTWLMDVLDATQLAINLAATDTINYALHTDTYTPVFDTHNLRGDVTNEVANGNGYTTGGFALANRTVGIASGYLKFDNTVDPSWAAASFTARGGVVWHDSTADTLLCAVTFGADYTATNGTFTVTLSANGIFRIKYNPAA